MNSYVHQYPSALYSRVTDAGYRGELHTGEMLRSGRVYRGSRTGTRRGLLGWLRPSSNDGGARSRDRQPVHPAPAPHHFELKFHRERHAR